jgi:hypothetical protein
MIDRRISATLVVFALVLTSCEIITPREDGTIAPTEVVLREEVCCRASHTMEPARYYRPDRMLLRTDGSFVFAGHFAGRPVVWNYTSRLEQEWEKRLLQDQSCGLIPNKVGDSFYAWCWVDGRYEYHSIDLDGNVRSLLTTEATGSPLPTSDGGFLAIRSTRRTTDHDVTVTRLDASGSIAWAHYFGDVSIEAVQYLNGTTIAVGDVPGELWWHPRDAVMIGIGTDGNQAWRRTVECEDGCRINRVFRLDGNFLLQGTRAKRVPSEENPDHLTQVDVEWLLMVSPGGDVVWDSWDHWQESLGFGEIRLVRKSPRGIEMVGWHPNDRQHHSVLLDADGRIVEQQAWPPQWHWGGCYPTHYAFRGDREIAVLYGCSSLACFRGSCQGDTWAETAVFR